MVYWLYLNHSMKVDAINKILVKFGKIVAKLDFKWEWRHIYFCFHHDESSSPGLSSFTSRQKLRRKIVGVVLNGKFSKVCDRQFCENEAFYGV